HLHRREPPPGSAPNATALQLSRHSSQRKPLRVKLAGYGAPECGVARAASPAQAWARSPRSARGRSRLPPPAAEAVSAGCSAGLSIRDTEATDLSRAEAHQLCSLHLREPPLDHPSDDVDAVEFLGAHPDQLLGHPSGSRATPRRRKRRTFLLGQKRTFSFGLYMSKDG